MSLVLYLTIKPVSSICLSWGIGLSASANVLLLISFYCTTCLKRRGEWEGGYRWRVDCLEVPPLQRIMCFNLLGN